MKPNILMTPQFKQAFKLLKKKRQNNILKDIIKIIEQLVNFEITTQKSNHPLSDGINDLHIRGDVILLYRYQGAGLIIDLNLLNISDHKELQKNLKLAMKDNANIPFNLEKEKKNLKEQKFETSSQGQILKRGDLSEYKISDKELEEVKDREIIENMSNNDKIVATACLIAFVDDWFKEPEYIYHPVDYPDWDEVHEDDIFYEFFVREDSQNNLYIDVKEALGKGDPFYIKDLDESLFEDEFIDAIVELGFLPNTYADIGVAIAVGNTVKHGLKEIDYEDDYDDLEESMTNSQKLMKRFPELNLKEDIEKGHNKLNKQEVLDWISEHELAWEDFVNYFEDVYPSSAEVPVDEIMGWISDHDDLAEDFENKFGISVNADVYDDDCDWFEDELEEHIAIDKYDQINSKNIIEVKPSKLKESVEGKWNIGSNKLVSTDSQEYANLVDLAKLLQERSPNHYEYRVEKTYEDFGAGMQWYTIICDEKNGWGTHQVLNTKQWLDLANTGDVESVYQDIVSNKYFQDTAEKSSIFNKLYTFDE